MKFLIVVIAIVQFIFLGVWALSKVFSESDNETKPSKFEFLITLILAAISCFVLLKCLVWAIMDV